jgi:hypothetical protein
MSYILIPPVPGGDAHWYIRKDEINTAEEISISIRIPFAKSIAEELFKRLNGIIE